MAAQEVIWTVLPRSVEPDLVLGVGRRLRISVLVSPRLGGTDTGGGGPFPVLTLQDFAEFVDWPATLDGRSGSPPVRFEVEFVDGPTLQARRVPVDSGLEPDSDLWRAVFPEPTAVDPFHFDDLSGTPMSSPAKPTAADALKGLWVLMAATSGATLPTIEQLDEALTEAGVRGGSGESGGLPPPPPDPTTGPRPGEETDPGYPDGYTGDHPDGYPGGDVPEHPADDGGAAGGATGGGTSGGGSGGGTAGGGSGGAQAGQQPPSTKAAVKDSIDQVVDSHKPGSAQASAPPSESDLVASFDFHKIVSFLSSHPEVMRRLGLLFDLELPFDDAVPTDGSGRVQQVRVLPSRSAPAGNVDHRPSTAYILDHDRFLAAPRPVEPAARNGFLRLDDTTRFRLEQYDVDGGAEKLQALVATVDGLIERIAAGEVLGVAPDAGLPALRSSGISVVHADVSTGGPDGLVSNSAASAVKASCQDSAVLNRQAAQQAAIGPLFAEQLTAGYRVDVWDDRSGSWHSACRRTATYTFLDAPAAGRTVVATDGEGMVERSVVRDPKKGLLVGADLLTWDGWSLCVPQPGLVLDPDGRLNGAGQGGGPDPPRVRLDIATKVTPGSLPRLRFGRQYRVRVRAVDLAGNSVALEAPPRDTPEASASLRYGRLEPVASPMVVLREVPAAGESVDHLVVTSGSAQAVTSTERHILPPKVSQRVVETHGLLDADQGLRSDTAAYELSKRESGSLEDAQHPLETAADPRGSPVLVRRETSLRVPWLADPLAHGALFLDLPGVAPNAFDLGVNRVPFSGTWPDKASFRLRVEGVAAGSARVGPALTEAGGERVLTVQLLPAEMVTLRLSSYIDVDADFDNLRLLTVWQWIEAGLDAAGRSDDLEALRTEAASGRNWLLMPYRKLVMVHAVARPLEAPAIRGPVDVDRLSAPDAVGFGDTFATARGVVDVHAPSTSKVDVLATWTDQVDDLGVAAPTRTAQMTPRTRQAHLGEMLVPEDLDRGFAVRHEFGDTRAHTVTYRVEATSRFREYFEGLGPEDLKRPVPGLEPAAEAAPVVVPATTRPLAPQVRYVVPSFTWTRSEDRDGDVVYRSTRKGHGLRVFVERPWFSSGEGELLGVVFAEDLSDGDPRTPLVTAWGADPLWNTQATDGRVRGEMFSGALRVDHGLKLAELDDARASVAGYRPQYDETRALWFFDVGMTFETETDADLRYYPFVRLALARYQPNGLVRGAEDVKLSRVVLADFVQLAPERTLTVSTAPSAIPGGVGRKVVVEGVAPVRLGGDFQPTTMLCSVLRRFGPGDELDWDEETPPTPMEPTFALTGQMSWESTVSFVPDSTERRLVVKELEALSPRVVVDTVFPEQRGTTHTIDVTGSGFMAGVTVDFGAGVVATVEEQTPNRLFVRVEVAPDAELGQRTVVVTNRDRSRGEADGFAVRTNPMIQSINPAVINPGGPAGPQEITMEVMDLMPGATVGVAFMSATGTPGDLVLVPESETVNLTGSVPKLTAKFTVTFPLQPAKPPDTTVFGVRVQNADLGISEEDPSKTITVTGPQLTK